MTITASDKPGKKLKEGFLGQKMIVLPPNIKRSAGKNPLISGLYLTAIGYYPHAAFHSRERKLGCSQYILLYCVGGTGSVTFNGKTHTLAPNHYVILPRNIAHQYSTSQEEPWTIYWVHFMGEHADTWYERYKDLKAEPASIPFDQRRAGGFELIFEILENSFDMRDLEVANLKLQDYLANFIYAREINPSISGEDKISDSIAFMKRNIAQQYSVQQLANQQRISVTHYTRLFRAKTGTSPNQYFSELKVQQSCQYLYFSDRNIKEICSELGFKDQYYFSRLFKKLMGISPAKYKNQHKRTG